MLSIDLGRASARAGQTITAKITTDSVDAALTLYYAAGQVLAGADDSAGTLAPTFISKVTRTGTYYLMVAGSGTRPHDPSDSGSGNGVTSEGTYTLSLSAAVPHTRYQAVHLRARRRRRRGGGRHPGQGRDLQAGRDRGRGLHRRRHPQPPRVQPSSLGQGLPRRRGGRGRVVLHRGHRRHPRFLPASAEKPLADAITADVRRRLQTDLAGSGINKRFGVRVLSSEHGADPGDAKNVDRVVIGGTIEETGLPTLGVTSSIDPGNFDTSDTSIVLLDLLNGPADDTVSLNHYMKPSSDRITFISTVVSNLVSHEIGHALGNWHTATDGTSTLMDNDSMFLGMGPDGIDGTPTTTFRSASEPMPLPTWMG